MPLSRGNKREQTSVIKRLSPSTSSSPGLSSPPGLWKQPKRKAEVRFLTAAFTGEVGCAAKQRWTNSLNEQLPALVVLNLTTVVELSAKLRLKWLLHVP